MPELKKIRSLLGICAKAGMISGGEYQCEQSVEKRKAFVVIIAEDASEGTKKKFRNAADHRKIPYITAFDKDELGKAVGRDLRAVLTVNNKDMASKILSLYK